MKKTKKTPQDSARLPQVLKEEEFGLMCRFISLGLWRDTNLAKVVGVNRDTIAEWKKRPEAQQAYQEACDAVLKKRKQRGDVEKEMKELDLEVTNDVLDVNHKVETWSDEQLKRFVESEATRRITG